MPNSRNAFLVDDAEAPKSEDHKPIIRISTFQ